jgi:hypothetical protein
VQVAAPPTAFQPLQNNNYFLVQMAILSHAAIIHAPPAPQPTPTQTAKPIEYIPLAREAKQRQDDTASSLFRMTKGSYDTAYGSTNGGWRDVSCSGRRFVLPGGCTPRRARRFM